MPTSIRNIRDGKHTFGEFHIVHVNHEGETDDVAVLAIWLTIDEDEEDGEHYDDFQQLLDAWKEIQTSTAESCGNMKSSSSQVESNPAPVMYVNVYDLIPENNFGHYYQYYGSLTTPPCTEQVLWIVVQEPLTISQSQADTLKSLVVNYQDPTQCTLASVASHNGTTNRPTQPLNGRSIEHICPPISFMGQNQRWGGVGGGGFTDLALLSWVAVVAACTAATFCRIRRHRQRHSYETIYDGTVGSLYGTATTTTTSAVGSSRKAKSSPSNQRRAA